MLRIAVTPGEPAGIGPDLVVAIAQQAHYASLVAVADPELLESRAEQLGLSLSEGGCGIAVLAQRGDAGGVVQAGHGVVEVAVLDWDPRGRADAVGHVLKKE